MVVGNLKTAICVCFYSLYCLIEGIFTGKLSAWGETEILFDEVELQRVTGIQFSIWSSIVSKIHS